MPYTQLHEPGIRELASKLLPLAPRLSDLDLTSAGLTERGLVALLSPQFAELDLRGNRIGSLAPLLHLSPAQGSSLRKIQLLGNPLSDSVALKSQPNLSRDLP